MSSVMNYEDNILAAIQTIVNDAVEHASYDKTIQATIKKVVDSTTGKYRITYQDSVFNAYSTSTDVSYSVGTNVYVLIPGNDMSRTKTILGTVDNLGADFINILTNEERYESMGVNIANSTSTFNLNSYVAEQLTKLYDRTNSINLINLNVDDAEMYLKQNDYFTLGAYFRTNLPSQQRAQGNYGISFDFVYENEQGEDEHRVYTIDIDSFSGSPYSLINFSKQTSTYNNLNKDKFKYIESISIFESGFPYNRSGEPDDIFIKDIQIFGARKITDEELASCMLSILTPQGSYFKLADASTATKILEAQIRVKGKIASDYSDTRFFWFRENAAVSKSVNPELYCSNGGSGWECLNEKNKTGDDVYEWVPADEHFTIKKSDVRLTENKFKCIALYNEDITLSREIVIYNKSALGMSINSSNGTQFYFDTGETTLTCALSETVPNLSYTWGKTDIYGNFNPIEGTTASIIVQARDINRFGVYKCSVYSGDDYIGTASTVLYNSADKTENARMIINNGSQVFKYNTDGIAPNNSSLLKPITILPLTFVLFDDDGAEIPQEKIASSAIEWLVPAENTLITIPDGYGIPIREGDWNVYNNLRSLNFNILTRYDANKNNNVIKLRITLGEQVYETETNLIFLKEGERGSNGTDFVCRVVPNNASGSEFVNQPIVTVYNNNYTLNYILAQNNRWFKTQLWHDGELIYENNENGQSTEDKAVSINWSVLRNSYSNSIKDNSNLAIVASTGEVTFNTTAYTNPANIIQCKITYDGVDYYDNIPVIVNFLNNNSYTINLKENSGFSNAMYASDGRRPQYDNAIPFEMIIKQGDEDISLADDTSYTWSIYGQYYENSAWHNIENLIPITSYVETHNLTKNQKRYKPVDTYDGLCLSNGVKCVITDDSITVGTIYIPIDLYINRYGNAALNEWNGNSIQLRQEDGIILSPQIGAGKKETDNTFTGMFMGDVQENASTPEETGLFGYYHGQRTIELNAENGTAKFGKTGAGQIIMDPTQNTATIRSGNYSSDNNTGLEIDLTDPHIKFGNGSKFQVDNQGNVTATGLTIGPSQVTGLSSTMSDVEDLKDTINYFEVTLDTGSITIPCTAETQKPLITANYVVNAQGYFKGTSATISNITTSDSYTNITFTKNLANQTITFGVDSTKAITNLVSSYNIVFSYINNGVTYTATKKIDLVLTQQGKDGEQGPAGPAGKDGTSVTVKGSYDTIAQLINEHPSGNTPGDGYVVNLDLYIYTNAAGGSGSLAGDWEDVGQFKGEDAKRCFIVASTEVFKSEDGGATYTPASSVLTPFFQSVNYSSWAYSTNGGSTFVTIVAGSIPTGISIDNSTSALTITNSCELFTTNNTLVFKCSSDNASVFDTITVARITDGVSSASTYLTNQTISFTGAADTGVVSGGTSETTNAVCYVGGSKIAPGIGTISGVPTDMTVTVAPNETANHERLITVSIPNDTTLGGVGNQKGTILIPIASPSSATTTLQLNWMKINAGSTGAPGSAGYNTAQVHLYQRASNTPSFSYSGNLTYTFATAILSGSIPTGWTQAIPASDGNPLYEVTAVAYANTATDTIASGEWTSPIIMVEDGRNGAAGRGIASTEVRYVADTQGTTPPADSASWSTNPPSGDNKGKYIWTRTRYTYTDNLNPTTSYSVAYEGNNGQPGTSVTITSQEIKYADGTSGTTVPTTGWQSSIPAVPDTHYLWTRTTVNYSDNTSTTSYSVAYQSKDGQDATQYYTYIRYSENADGHDMVITPTASTKYVGICVSTSSDAPIYTAFTWSKYIGEDGYSVWTSATDPTASNNTYTFNRSALTGPTGVDPKVGEFIYGPRYRYTIATVTSTQVTATVRTDLKGSNGTSATNVVCGNEAQTIVCDENGAVKEATTITIPFAGYLGSSRKACSVAVTNLPTGITVTSNTAATTSADGSLVLTAAANSTLGNHSNGEITLTFSCNSLTFVKKFAWSKAIAGQDGTSPYISYLTNESQTFAAATAKTVTTDLYAYQGATEKSISFVSIGTYTFTNSTAINTNYDTGKANMQFSVNAKSGTHPTISFKASANLAQSVTEQIPIVYKIADENVNRTIYFSYSSTTNAKIVNVNPSSQIFKSTTGASGTFAPEYIYLYPDFQGCSYSKWQYWDEAAATPAWVDVISGQNGLTIGTYNGVANSLRIANNSNLYTDIITSIPFKCISNEVSVYDTVSIIKIYDVTELEIGGRNFLLKSNTTTGDTGAYLIAQYNISDYGHLVDGQQYALSINFTNTSERHGIRCYVGGNTLGIGDWRAISNAGTHSECWIFTATSAMASANQWIEVYCSNSSSGGATVSGTCQVNWIKLESGNLPTDWTIAPEDAVLKSSLQYIMTNNDTIPSQNDSNWTDSLGTQDKTKYIWQRIVYYGENGNLVYDSAGPTLIQYPIKAIKSTETAYSIGTDPNVPPSGSSAIWTNAKPAWTKDNINNYLWYRITTSYTDDSDPTIIYGIDESWKDSNTMFNSVTNITNNIYGEIQNSVVDIRNGTIEVSNIAGTAKIVINSAGIAFMYKDDQGVWQGEEAVWGYDDKDGWTFNSENINVLHLQADNITNGKLTLKGTNLNILRSYPTKQAMIDDVESPTASSVYYVQDEQAVYRYNEEANQWEKQDGGEFILQDKDNHQLCTIDANGLNILCKDGSRFMVRANADENNRFNLQMYDSHNSLFAYVDTTNGTWVTTESKVTTSLQIGDRTGNNVKNVKIIPIGNGIGFIGI